MNIIHISTKVFGLVKTVINEFKLKKRRSSFNSFIYSFFKNINTGETPTTVIVDAAWDNPNYWLRYSFIRSALNLENAKEVGVIGEFRREQQKITLRQLNINSIENLCDMGDFAEKNYSIARRMCDSVDSQKDILDLQLPHKLPATFLYDYILKKQKAAFIEIENESFLTYVHEFLNYISVAEKIIKDNNPSLVISSHAIGLYSPLVWIALSNRIKVIILCGGYGGLRFWQLRSTSEIYHYDGAPHVSILDKLSSKQQDHLHDIGEEAISKRLRGKAYDVGAWFAYKNKKESVTKESLCSLYNWNEDKKIVGVYASNFFDYPHIYGMTHFENFHDWLNSIFLTAKKNTNVNWIIKAHPCDGLYAGVSVSDLIKIDGKYSHIRFAETTWDGASTIKAIDAFITYHGTIGVEASALGKPVMVSDRGWYDNWGFVKVPNSGNEFLELLETAWWDNMKVEENSRKAKILAGFFWGRPTWQKQFLLDDDSNQWEIYKTGVEHLKNNKEIVQAEFELIEKWLKSEYQHYHVYKMLQTDSYQI